MVHTQFPTVPISPDAFARLLAWLQSPHPAVAVIATATGGALVLVLSVIVYYRHQDDENAL